MAARALHYVFKVGNRKHTYDFFTEVLKMKVLRHEEFEQGCKATCNGPYDGRWSKTMIGYGCEDENFVIELTYNYTVGHYDLGNDFRAIVIEYDQLYDELLLKEHRKTGCGRLAVTDPDGHVFKIGRGSTSPMVTRVQVNIRDLTTSLKYWSEILGMNVVEKNEERAILQFADKQCKWEMVKSTTVIERGSAFGRIAFSCPSTNLKGLQEKVKATNGKVINELVTLETPGKADVQVVILADPDAHEICFVGDEGFRELSKADKSADETIRKAIEKDDSADWYEKGKK